MLAPLTEGLTVSAKRAGVQLALELFELLERSPIAYVQAPAPGIQCGDVEMLASRCEGYRLDLSLAHASGEDGQDPALRLRRASILTKHGCPRKETADRVRARLAMSRQERGLRSANILKVLKITRIQQRIGGGVAQQAA